MSRRLVVLLVLFCGCRIGLVAPTTFGAERGPEIELKATLVRFDDVASEQDRKSQPDPVWWEGRLTAPILSNRSAVPMSLNEAITIALDQAPELKALHNDYLIGRNEVIRQEAAFDWSVFVEAIWNRDSTPVGSVLDGAANRLRSRSLANTSGIRRRNRSGGELQLSQDFGFLNSNSQFVLPNNQGTSRLSLGYEQPLLKGKGREYNNARANLAVLNSEIAYYTLQIGVQDYLLQIAQAYWSLVLARGQFALESRASKLAIEFAAEMEERTDIDVRPRQMNRVQMEVATRSVSATDSLYNVLRAQQRLLRYVFGGAYEGYSHEEIVTTSVPPRSTSRVQLDERVQSGLRNRPELYQAIRRIRSACVEQQIAKNEVLPELNFVLSGYVAGLRGDADIGTAFVDQFREGEPGVGTGLNFNYSLGNRSAKAALRQRRLAVARFRNELQTVTAQVILDIREQATEYNRYNQVIDMRLAGLRLAVADLDNLTTRKRFLIDGSRVADLYLEDILQSQNRKLRAEFDYLSTQVGSAVAESLLYRAVGGGLHGATSTEKSCPHKGLGRTQ